MNENNIHIERNFANDTLSIYWRERIGSSKELWYHYNGVCLEVTETTNEGYRPSAIKPFIELPLRIGEAFLILLSNKVTEMGINQRMVDEGNGKLKLLESELNFNKEQLVKFINHFTK